MRDGNGKHHECRLALGAFIADLQEQWDALGLRHMRDVSTLATRGDVGNLDSDPRLRHEDEMKEVGENDVLVASLHAVANMTRVHMPVSYTHLTLPTNREV